MWGISGQEINIFPTSSPRVVNKLSIPTISHHFPQLFTHKLSINPHFSFMYPTPKSTFYPQIKILSMCSCTKTLETSNSKLDKVYQHSLNINPTQLSASHLVFGMFASSSTLNGSRISPGKGETSALPRAGHSARFSISGR